MFVINKHTAKIRNLVTVLMFYGVCFFQSANVKRCFNDLKIQYKKESIFHLEGWNSLLLKNTLWSESLLNIYNICTYSKEFSW